MNLELEKKKLELIKVQTALAELEYRVLERVAEIERIRQNIATQNEAIDKLNETIKSMEG